MTVNQVHEGGHYTEIQLRVDRPCIADKRQSLGQVLLTQALPPASGPSSLALAIEDSLWTVLAPIQAPPTFVTL
jgi:hypothetical protein